jgi:hypothetical protein
VPVTAEPDGKHRLREEDERADGGEEERSPAPAVEPDVAGGRDRVENRAGREEPEQERSWIFDRLVEWREGRERHARPERHCRGDRRVEQSAPADHGFAAALERQRRPRADRSRKEEPGGGRDLKTSVLPGQ